MLSLLFWLAIDDDWARCLTELLTLEAGLASSDEPAFMLALGLSRGFTVVTTSLGALAAALFCAKLELEVVDTFLHSLSVSGAGSELISGGGSTFFWTKNSSQVVNASASILAQRTQLVTYVKVFDRTGSFG